MVQDGGVETHVLTPSCESTRITNNCWTIINRKTLGLTKKDTPHPKTKEGHKHNKIKSHNHWVGDSQTGEHLYHRSPHTGGKVLSPTLGFPTWGSSNRRRNSQRIRLSRLLGFDCRTLTGLEEKETPLLDGTHKVVCASGPRGKEQWPHRRLNQSYLLVLEGLLQRWGMAVAHRGDKDTGSRSSRKYSLAWALLSLPLAPPESL